MRFRVLVNPLAGAGRALAPWPEAQRILAGAGRVQVETPLSVGALAAAARAAAAAGETIVVAGGDGTAGRVIDAVQDLPATLGLLPVGSGNDLVRALGLPLDPVAAARRIVAGTPRAIDVVSVNGRRFCTVGGFGVVAHAAALVSHVGGPGQRARPIVRRLGGMAYLFAAAGLILLERGLREHAVLSGDAPNEPPWRIEGRWDAVLVANQRALGAGLALPVPSEIDDGVCELCLVPAGSRLGLVRKLAYLRPGRRVPADALIIRRARRATIEWERPTPFTADGDGKGEATRYDIRVQPKAISILL